MTFNPRKPFLADTGVAERVRERMAHRADLGIEQVQPDPVIERKTAARHTAAPAVHYVVWFYSPMSPKPTVEITAEVAATPRKRAVGLSQHQALHPFAGMLFLHPQGPAERQETFHMGGVPFAIDLVFVRRDHRIGKIVHNIHPSDPGRWGYKKTAAVIEVVGGFCKSHGIKLGDEVGFGHAIEAGGPMAPVPSVPSAKPEEKQPPVSSPKGPGKAPKTARDPEEDERSEHGQPPCSVCHRPGNEGEHEIPDGLACEDCFEEYVQREEEAKQGQAQSHDLLRTITEA
jgi:uncharacterized membrane protein (UPF0127 family)